MSGETSHHKFETGLKTLEEAAELSDRLLNTVGIIFDATGFYKTNRSLDYVIKLRIFDQSLDPSVKNADVEPYVMVFLYFTDRSDVVAIPRVGDIIVLQNFLVSVNEYKKMTYITATFNHSCSGWQVYDGAEEGSNLPILSTSKKANYFFEEYNRVKALRAHSKDFFSRHSLLGMCWHRPPLPANVDRYQIVHMKDVDALGKLIQECKIEVHGEVYRRLVFQDADGVQMICEIKSNSIILLKNEVYKLRSISVIEEKSEKMRKLIHYEHSALLLLPGYFKDALTIKKKTERAEYPYEKLQSQFISELHLSDYNQFVVNGVTLFSRNEVLSDSQMAESLLSQFPSLEEYYLDDLILNPRASKKKRICSVVRTSDAEKAKLVDLEFLESILAKCNHSPAQSEGYQGLTLRVAVNLEFGLPDFDPLEAFQLYLNKSLKTFKLNKLEEALKELDVTINPPQKQKKKGEETRPERRRKKEELVLMLNMPFRARDKSCQRGLLLYLATDDGNPQGIFELWKIFDGFSDFRKFSENVDAYKAQLVEHFRLMASSDKVFNLVVQFVQPYGKNPYFRIVNTKFLPLN